MEKDLPQNIEAEQWLLGGLLLQPRKIALVADFLRPAHFFRLAHRTIYEAMLEMVEQRDLIDPIGLADTLERHGKLKDVGGMFYLTDLYAMIPSSAGVEQHAKIVAEHYDWRDLIYVAGKIAALGYERAPDARSVAQQLLMNIELRERGSLVDLSEIMEETLLDIEEAHKQHSPVTGVATGFTAIDAMLGGLQPTDLILLAGRPAMGKSALGLCMGYNAACKDKRVGFFSMEMGRKQLAMRLIAMLTGIPVQRLRNGWITDEEYAQVAWAHGELHSLPLSIDDASDNPVVSLRSKILRWQMEHQKKLDLVVIDYIQLMEPEEHEKDHRHHENRVQELTQISRGLKKLAMEFNVPVLAMAQLSREVEKRAVKIPQLSDLRDSGSLEQDADIVMFAYRDEYYAGFDKDGTSKSDRPGVADIIIAKHRNGDTGEVQLRFVGPRTRFYNLDEEEGTT